MFVGLPNLRNICDYKMMIVIIIIKLNIKQNGCTIYAKMFDYKSV